MRHLYSQGYAEYLLYPACVYVYHSVYHVWYHAQLQPADKSLYGSYRSCGVHNAYHTYACKTHVTEYPEIGCSSYLVEYGVVGPYQQKQLRCLLPVTLKRCVFSDLWTHLEISGLLECLDDLVVRHEIICKAGCECRLPGTRWSCYQHAAGSSCYVILQLFMQIVIAQLGLHDRPYSSQFKRIRERWPGYGYPVVAHLDNHCALLAYLYERLRVYPGLRHYLFYDALYLLFCALFLSYSLKPDLPGSSLLGHGPDADLHVHGLRLICEEILKIDLGCLLFRYIPDRDVLGLSNERLNVISCNKRGILLFGDVPYYGVYPSLSGKVYLFHRRPLAHEFYLDSLLFANFSYLLDLIQTLKTDVLVP